MIINKNNKMQKIAANRPKKILTKNIRNQEVSIKIKRIKKNYPHLIKFNNLLLVKVQAKVKNQVEQNLNKNSLKYNLLVNDGYISNPYHQILNL